MIDLPHRLHGAIAQCVHLTLQPGQHLWCSNGSLMAYDPGVRWRLKIPVGLGGALKRSIAGEGLSLTYVETEAPDAEVLLASNAPGHITTWDLADGPVVTTRGAFLAAWGEDLDITPTVAKRAGAAFFGGAGLFLQRVAGRGTVLVYGSGDFYDRTLRRGEQLLVSTGNLAAFSGDVDYDIQGVGGCRNVFFSGEGLFLTKLTGPGRILLQTLKRGAAKAT